MSITAEDLVFTAEPLISYEGRLVVSIPPMLADKEGLITSLASQLKFPDYWSANWDSVWDMVRDLEWISQHEIVLQHADFPQLPERDALQYVDVLSEGVRYWQHDSRHSFVVAWRPESREMIKALARLGTRRL